MFRKIVAVWVSLAMLLGFVVIVDVVTDITPPVRAITITVDDSGGAMYTKIQDAINVSNDGDMVFVYSGTYYENVIVNKTIYLTGENRETTIIDGNEDGNVIQIESHWVNITGFTVTNGTCGIRVLSSNNNIINNNISGNGKQMFGPGVGIILLSSYNNTISNNKISSTIPDIMMMNDWYGIYLSTSPYNDISNNIISYNGELSSNGYGIYLHSSSNITIIDNEIISNYGYGIRIWYSDNVLIKGNNVLNNMDGLYISESTDINLTFNNIFNNAMGITFYKSSNNTITNNIFINDDILIRGTVLRHFNSHTISTDNTVNGRPLYYIKNSNSFDIDGSTIPIGELILVNCTNITVRSMDVNNTDVGIEIAHSNNSVLSNCNFTLNEMYGIYLDSSKNISITGSNISNNYCRYNLFLSLSSYCIITDNIISYNTGDGVRFYTSDNNSIKNNTIIDNGGGIRLEWSSSYNKIIGNNVSTNTKRGIHLETSSSYNFVKNNIILNNDDGMVLATNTPTNNTVENNIISWNNNYGIILSNSRDTNITGNIIEFNANEGIYIAWSYECVISGNTIANNYDYGIYVVDSSNNWIFHNNFINNTNQAYDFKVLENQWDNSYPAGGNYWSDYTGNDSLKGPLQNIPGSDGIGDTNHSIDIDTIDRYPLMEPYTGKPYENYTILHQGWNLISVPLIQDKQDLTKVLEMIDGYYDAVQFYNNTDPSDPWKHYRPGKPFGNDLSYLNESMGFWIHITNPGDTIFLYNGTQPSSNQSIALHPGWNMVGYPSLINRNRTEALNNINYGIDVDAIWTYNAATQTWQEIGPSDSFELGRGYWMHSKVTKVWDVPL